MLMFHTNEEACKNIFHSIYESLDQQELEEYPFHYDILEKKQECYEEYVKNREIYQSNIKLSRSNNPTFEIRDKMDTYDRNEKNKYTSTILEYYRMKIMDVDKNKDTDINKKKQVKNLQKEMNDFQLNPDFCYQDVFQKHKDFIFTKSNKPMDADTIRSVRREIKKTLGIKIAYESPLFQMLKRGIGLFIDNMPDEYNWILQKLLSNKEIGIVISDRTLCLGIDLPVRSSCFLGINNSHFTKDEYLQMSGRAGRRGKDICGNIIFYGDMDYLSLMKGELPEIQGNPRPIYDSYKVYPSSEVLFQNMINNQRKVVHNSDLNITDRTSKMIWSLRRFKNSSLFIQTLSRLEKQLYQKNEHDREEFLLKQLSILLEFDILEYYKAKKIKNYQDVNKIKEYMNIIMYIHNLLNYQQYMITMNVMKDIFSSLIRMMYNYII